MTYEHKYKNYYSYLDLIQLYIIILIYYLTSQKIRMKNIYNSIIVFLLSLSTLVSQVDQISLGENYSQQAYYNLETGEVTTIKNTSWDIAFSNLGQQDAGIFINESASLVGGVLKLYSTDVTDWSTPITDTSIFTDSNILYNNEESWESGAFNKVAHSTDPFDYGWGAYNPQTHIVEGTTIYVIEKRDGTFIKFQMESLLGGTYNFRIANLDGSNEILESVSKNENLNQSIILYSIAQNTTIEIPEYDLIFQRYTTPLDAGSGDTIEYTVTGILLAAGVEAAVAYNVNPYDVELDDYLNDFSSNINTIGHDWKYYDFSSGWIMDQQRVQFVKTKNNNYYKLVFYDFEGSSTGVITFEKTNLGIISSTNNNSEEVPNLNVYPNPTTEIVNISGITQKTKVELFSVNGERIFKKEIEKNNTFNISHLPQGQYIFHINTEGINVNKTIIVQK